MYIKFDFRPTSVGDFLLKISTDESEPKSGAYVGPFISEEEVHAEFAKLEAEVKNAKKMALRLVKRAAVEAEKGVGSAHRAYKSILSKADPPQ